MPNGNITKKQMEIYEYLKKEILSKDGSAYIPFVDSLGATGDAANVNWGTSALAEIYKEETEK